MPASRHLAPRRFTATRQILMVIMKELRLLCKHLLFVLLPASLVLGCDSNTSAKPGTPPDNGAASVATPSPVPQPIDTLSAAALEYCNCFKQTMGRFDPQVEALILKSIEQPEPMKFLEMEIGKMTDPASQEQALKDLDTFSNFDAASPCIQSVSRKYGIDEANPATLQGIILALERYPDCRLVTALFKVGYTEATAD